VKVNGISFAYIKATEGTEYVNSYFAQQYEGSYSVGLIRGSYHFARPDIGSGNVQADYFVDHGGGWSPDGQTLPGVLDIEYNPYGPICYGLSHGDMVNWIQSFSDEYYSRTQRYPVIYSTLDWWTTCTGNSGALGNNNPLWIAR
jgi:GH25 family lysozyme M1 (1,4-beta-N-acetylmuramidase)